MVDLAPTALVCRHTCDSSETGEEPFRKGAYRVCGEPLVYLPFASGDLETDEVLTMARTAAGVLEPRNWS